jgi:hypothetical protein
MADEDEIDRREFDDVATGDDSPPLMNLVHDKPYSRGSLTSQGRTASRQYQEFLERNRNARK